MSKTKYRYNPETLSYEEVKLSLRDKVVRVVLFLLPAIVLVVIGGILGATLFKSPREIRMERENALLTQELSNLNERINFTEEVLQDIEHRDDNVYRVIFEADPYPRELRMSDRTRVSTELEESEVAQLLDRTHRRLDKLEQELYHQSKSFDEVKRLVEQKNEMLASIPSIQPIKNDDLTRLSSGFGVRMHPIYKIAQLHPGIDFTAPVGTEIYATGNGVVEEADWMGGYGRVVIIDHGFGFKTVYAHCNGFNVKKGDEVKRGQVIAFLGSSGFSTGPHVHYEVRRKTTIEGRSVFEPVDPVHYFFNDLSPEEYEKVIEVASHANQMMS